MLRRLAIKKPIYSDSSEMVNRYYTDISKTPLLSVDEEILLFEKYKGGDNKAREKIIISNQRFVVSVAKKYTNKKTELLDLINEGNIGLITAVEKFDTTKGFRFISYAVWYIRQRIMTFIDNYNLIKKNKYWSLTKNIEEIKKKVRNEEFRDVSYDEIVELLRDEYDVHIDIEDLYNIGVNSIDEISDNDLAITEHEFNCKYNSYNDIENIIQKEDCEYISKNLMSILNDKEKKVIEMCFGIGLDKSYNLIEISDAVGYSAQRVGLVRDKALRKMKHRYNSKITSKK